MLDFSSTLMVLERVYCNSRSTSCNLRSCAKRRLGSVGAISDDVFELPCCKTGLSFFIICL
jgi:hypothetical protein